MRSVSSPLFIVALAVLFGASIDAGVKYFAASVSVVTLMAWRFLIGGAALVSVYISQNKPAPSWKAIRFHTLRGAVQLTAALTFFWSLTQLALAEVTVIGFTAALMVAPIARIILGEQISRTAGIAALIGFAGAVFAASGTTEGAPADGNRVLGVAACLIAALCYALTLVLVRLRTKTEDTLTIVMFTNVVPGLILLPYLLATGPIPSAEMLPVYLALAFAGVGVWWLMTTGYANAEAQLLAPLEYTALIWASLFGWLFFREVPSWQLWVGALVIITACLVVAFESRFRARNAAHLPASDILE